jgi:hypothetical protein
MMVFSHPRNFDGKPMRVRSAVNDIKGRRDVSPLFPLLALNFARVARAWPFF